MDTLGQLRAIRETVTVYAILFRNAGVALQFYEGPEVDAMTMTRAPEAWRKGLKIYRYYPTLEEAVDAEYNRLVLLDAAAPESRDFDDQGAA